MDLTHIFIWLSDCWVRGFYSQFMINVAHWDWTFLLFQHFCKMTTFFALELRFRSIVNHWKDNLSTTTFFLMNINVQTLSFNYATEVASFLCVFRSSVYLTFIVLIISSWKLKYYLSHHLSYFSDLCIYLIMLLQSFQYENFNSNLHTSIYFHFIFIILSFACCLLVRIHVFHQAHTPSYSTYTY